MPKISELPLANKLKEEDYIPIVQDGVTKKVKGTHFVTEEEYSLDAFSPTIAANDKAMYKFGEGDTVDFSDSAYDGAYKSAILKGLTLVNKLKSGFGTNPIGISTATKAKYTLLTKLEEGKDYTISFDLEDVKGSDTLNVGFGWGWAEPITASNGRHTIKFPKERVTTEPTFIAFYFHYSTTSANVKNVVVVEGDYTNINIPYFEGMASVKMPVLTTTGKNLFDLELTQGSHGYGVAGIKPDFSVSNSRVTNVTGNYIKVNPNTKITFSISNDIDFAIAELDINGYTLGDTGWVGYTTIKPNHTITTKEKTSYIGFNFRKFDNSNITAQEVLGSNPMLEISDTATTYEPYKSNILSTQSDLELRGIGDVQDTLNLLTGEVTEATGVYSFTGNETFTTSPSPSNTELLHFSCNIKETNSKTKYGVVSNYLPKSTSLTSESIFNDWGWFNIVIRKDRLSEPTTSGLKAKLKEWFDEGRPLQAVYILPEKVHKTVDLSGTPFGYKGGHIIKSSAEGSLLPKFEYEVAVSRGAQISQNTSTLIKHDEKITELLKKTAATYINQKAEIAYLLNMSSTLEEVQTIPFIEDDYVNDDCMVDSDMVMDDMELEPEKEIIDNVDTLLINLIYDLIELNDTLGLSEKVELFRQSGLIDKHNYEIIKEKLNPSFKEEDYADINQ